MESSFDFIERKAVNSAGRLGSLYDGYRDHIIEQYAMNNQEQWLQPSEPPQCKLTRGDADASNNILRWIDTQDELRLSLLLKLTKRDGIAAILNYSYRIDQYTRFLYYSWIGREHVLKEIPEVKKISGLRSSRVNATHIITGVRFGIDLLVVIRLPPKTNINDKIDTLLTKISDILLKEKNYMLYLTSEENDLLENFLNTTVYSNIPTLTGFTKISDLLNQIKLIKKNSKLCRPLTYTLHSITSLYPENTKKAITFITLPSAVIDHIERHMLQFRKTIKYFEASLKGNVPRHLQHLLKKANFQFLQVKDKFLEEIRRLSKLIVDIRNGRAKTSEISRALCADKQVILKNSVDDVNRTLRNLEKEGCLIINIQQQQLDYWNATMGHLDTNNGRRITEQILTNNDRRDRVLYSTDALKENKPEEIKKLHCESINERKNNSNLHLVNTGFTHDDSELPDITTLSSKIMYNECNYSQSLPVTHRDIAVALPLSPPFPTDEIINILLLGETGVGKSTFINAFANYLTFNSLEQAQSNEPIVIIPVSFIMTTGDSFEECTIKFGEFDSSNNENFNSIGQSVTQHCKSDVFDLHHINGKKLRIIDTPGFGDTRGLDQDDRNMEHILQYINNLTHLNAICFLLKPNSSRLNMFFRTCLTQLFSFLNPDARENVIFCFTNGRSTFYTPGDTAPLLKAMLAASSMNDISLKKENTFCFDSESFRYLVALQNGISFTNEDKHEYETSWSISVKESNRLINRIDTKLTVYHMKSGWQSIKHAQFEISHMIRPILETMRNILRNIILCTMNSSNKSINLRPKFLHHPATICRSCKLYLHQVGQFWIALGLPHGIENDCDSCQCPFNQHIPIDYVLEYELSNNSTKCDQNQMIAMLNGLCHACAEYAHFLIHVARSTKDDPFLTGLGEMIDEEADICESQKLPHFNMQLVEELRKLENQHKQRMNKLKPNDEYVGLPAIYTLIKTTGEYPLMREQMAAVKQTQQMMMEQHEYEAQRI